jgi:hypothetical protein
MSQVNRENINTGKDNDAYTGLLIAGGIGLVIGTILGKRVLKRTIKIIIVRTVIKRLLEKIA